MGSPVSLEFTSNGVGAFVVLEAVVDEEGCSLGENVGL